MNLKKVVIITDESDIPRIERILNSLTQLDKSLIQGRIIYGQVGKDVLISFNTGEQQYSLVVEKLYINKIGVLSDLKPADEKQLLSLERKASNVSDGGWESVKIKVNLDVPIEKYIEAGKYSELIKISRDIRLGQIVMSEAKRRLPQTISKAIELEQRKYIKSSHDAHEAINSLINISSDPNLKIPQYSDFTKTAAQVAIKLISLKSDEIYRLIDICNNNEIHHIGPVKAAITFTEIVFRSPDIYAEEIEYAVKKINIRWLQICFPIVEHDLGDNEIALFNKLITYITENR